MPRARSILLPLLLILAVTLLMRGPVTCLGPLADRLTAELSLTPALYGFIAALPVAAFGLVSFAAPPSVKRFGLLRAAGLFLLISGGGSLLRSVPAVAALTLGTFLTGAGIAALNVLMPAVIKTTFASRAPSVMGWYTGTIGLSGAVGASAAVPLALFTGFTGGCFAAWGTAALIVWLIWTTRPLYKETQTAAPAPVSVRSLLTQPAAWALTAVMGIQSLLIYTVAAWLPPFLISNGLTAADGGNAVAVFLLAGLPASVFTAKFLARSPSYSAGAFLLSLSYLAGLGCWSLGGIWVPVGSVLAGAPQGAMLSSAFILMTERTKSAPQMLAVSAMSQGFGYIGAGAGPYVFALLTGGTAQWLPAWGFVAFNIVLWACAVTAACRLALSGTQTR